MEKIVARSLIVVALFLIVTPAHGMISISSSPGWWWAIGYDGSSEQLMTPHESITYSMNVGGSGGVGVGGWINRGVYVFNLPGLIRGDYAGYEVVSATLNMDMQYGHCNQVGYSPMPGVKAYYVEVTDHSWSGNISAGDFSAPVKNELGYVVPAGGTINDDKFLYLPGETAYAHGSYSVDITTAMQNAVAHPEYGVQFGVRLQLGNDTTGALIDPSANFDYVFSGQGYTRIDLVLASVPEPTTIGLLAVGGILLAKRRKD